MQRFYQRFGQRHGMAQMLDHDVPKTRPALRFLEEFRARAGLLCDWIITYVSVHGLRRKTCKIGLFLAPATPRRAPFRALRVMLLRLL